MREACATAVAPQMLDCDGVAIAAYREGSGLPVVCLHAVGHGSGDFDALATLLGEGFELIRLDWPGHGRSAADHHPPGAQRYAELLGLALSRLQVERPVLIGNSIGGAAAICFAAVHPARALVLCDSGGLVPVNGFVRAVVAAFVAFFRAGERGARWFGTAYVAYYRFLVLPTAAAREQRGRIVAAGYQLSALLRRAWESFGAPAADLRATAARLTLPVWCAWARGDRVIPLWMCRPAIRRIPGARITRYRGGHAPFLESPDAFARDFLAFADAVR